MKRMNATLLYTLTLAGLLAASGSARAIAISEVLYDAVGSDDGYVFVELWGPAGVSLDGFTLEGVNGSDGAIGPIVPLSGIVPADGFFVVADSSAGVTFVPDADLVVNFDLQNGPDSVLLRDAAGLLLDALGYGTFAAGDVFAGEGAPAPDPPSGQSLARLFANVDTDDNAADFVALETPTPGTGPVLVPEPGSAALLGLACAGLASARRRRAQPPWTVRGRLAR